MSFDALEQQSSGALPYELYLFHTVGITYGLTSADVDITYLGQVYTSTSVSRTEVEHSNEVVSGQIQIYLPKAHPLAQLFVPYLPPAPMDVTVFGGHYSDTEAVLLFSGRVASARFTDQCELVCNSDQYLLQRKIPIQLYQSPCIHVFGDAGCKVPVVANYTYPGTVSAIDSTGVVITVPEFASLPAPLKAGYLVRGNDYRMIVNQAGAVITLLSGISGLAVGQAVKGAAGCGHRFSDCSFYNNVNNFFGFDLIPEINPFDGAQGTA